MMKKMIFGSMEDLKKMIDFLEKHNFEYSWYFLDKQHEVHLGDTNYDHVRWLIRELGIKIPFKWGDYSW